MINELTRTVNQFVGKFPSKFNNQSNDTGAPERVYSVVAIFKITNRYQFLSYSPFLHLKELSITHITYN